jgi:hypothetical protein
VVFVGSGRQEENLMRAQRREQFTPTDDGVSFIQLTQGQIAIVDTEDYARLSRHNWCATWEPNTKSFYAVRTDGARDGARTAMSREVLEMSGDGSGGGPRLQADHENHDTLDNRKRNLRKCTQRQNSLNRRPTGASGYKGVALQDGRWRAQIFGYGDNHKHISLGCFDTPEEAARAYDRAARKLRGKYAYLNFP